jgi:hypothetical protein
MEEGESMTMQVFAPDPPNDPDIGDFGTMKNINDVVILMLHPDLAKTKPWASFIEGVKGWVEVRESKGVARWCVHYQLGEKPTAPRPRQNEAQEPAGDVVGGEVVSVVGEGGERVSVGLKYILEQ